MKIPKNTPNRQDDGIENLSADHERGTWKDVICDKCGQSCRDKHGMNFEFATIKAYWGFYTSKDCEKHEAQICEACYDGLGLKPDVSNYL